MGPASPLEHKPRSLDVVERRNHPAGETLIKLLHTQRLSCIGILCCRTGLAVFVKHKNQINIRGDIELATAKFSHTDNQQILRLA